MGNSRGHVVSTIYKIAAHLTVKPSQGTGFIQAKAQEKGWTTLIRVQEWVGTYGFWVCSIAALASLRGSHMVNKKALGISLAVSLAIFNRCPWLNPKDATWVAIAAAVAAFAGRLPLIQLTLPILAGFATQQILAWSEKAFRQVKVAPSEMVSLNQLPLDLWRYIIHTHLKNSPAQLPLRATCRFFYKLTPLSPQAVKMFSCYASHGRFEVLDWGRKNGLRWNIRTTRAAAHFGNISLLHALRVQGCAWDASTCSYAANSNQLSTLQWARANGCPWDSNTLLMAAREGHLELLKWAYDNGCPQNRLLGSLDNLFLLEVVSITSLFNSIENWICFGAALGGQIEVLEWCLAKGYRCGPVAFGYAALNKRFKVLEWAEQHGDLNKRLIFVLAALREDIPLLEWAKANQCPWHSNVTATAACNGNLETLQWLRKNGCPWDGRVRQYAARNNHQELLAWAIANGAP